MATKKGGLGRGLEALFNENASDSGSAVTLRLSDIEPNRNQPRKSFDEEALSELSESIKKHGLIQPIVVRPEANGTYRIIAGERRWRACVMANLSEVPVVIKETDDRELMELALIENLQRENLNPVEEALGFRSLMETYGMTQENVSESVGKSRSAVANSLRLLSLNENELELLKQSRITAGHARALLSCEEGELRGKMLQAALNGASVRELENMARSGKAPAKPKKAKDKESYFEEVELALKNELGRRVLVKNSGKESGTLTVEFFSREELADFAKKLAGE